MGRPKSERPADPILAVALGTETANLPALMPTHVALGDNAAGAADDLANGVLALRYIEGEIAILNARKSVVFAVLKQRGYDKKLIKGADKETRLSPEAQARLEAEKAAYRAALTMGLDRLQEKAANGEQAALAIEAEFKVVA